MKNVKWVITGEIVEWDNEDGSHTSAPVNYQPFVAWLAAGNTPAPYVPPPPPPKTLFTFLEFMALFTPTEQATIVNSTSTQVKIFLLMATGAGEIDMTNPLVKGGLDALVTGGLITADRETAILAGQVPA